MNHSPFFINSSTIVKTSAIIAASVFLIASSIGPLAAANNGTWSIVLTTQAGKCEATIAARFLLDQEDIKSTKGNAFKVEGVVERNGTMWARLRQSRHLYRIQGKFRSTKASGSWSSNTRLCGGTWRGKLVQ